MDIAAVPESVSQSIRIASRQVVAPGLHEFLTFLSLGAGDRLEALDAERFDNRLDRHALAGLSPGHTSTPSEFS